MTSSEVAVRKDIAEQKIDLPQWIPGLAYAQIIMTVNLICLL